MSCIVSIDPHVRLIAIGAGAYSKWCANKCPFMISAQWTKNDGLKNQVIEVTCCAQGGLPVNRTKATDTDCPHGLGWGFALGEAFIFNPDNFWKDEINEIYGTTTARRKAVIQAYEKKPLNKKKRSSSKKINRTQELL